MAKPASVLTTSPFVNLNCIHNHTPDRVQCTRGKVAEGSTKEEASSPSACVALTNANPSYLLKTVLTKREEESVTGAAEAILLGLENPTTNQVLILTFHV